MKSINQFRLDADLPFLRGHAVQGRSVLPGLAYVDLLYQSFDQSFGDEGHELHRLALRNLCIYNPLMLASASQSIELEIEWTPGGGGLWLAVVQGRLTQPAASPWVRYASAEMQLGSPTGFNEVIEPGRLREGARRIVALDDQYARCRAQDLVHDDYMRAQGEVWVCGDGLYADLRLGEQATATVSEALAHPTLLDAAAVTLGLASQDEVGTVQLFLPLFFDGFSASRALPARCFVRLLRDSIKQRHELRYMTFEFFDEAGRKVAELKNLTAKLVRESGLASAEVAAAAVATPALEQPGSSVADEGAEQAAEHFLRELIGRHVQRLPRTIAVDVGYYELGLNSAHLMELGLAVSRKVGVDLPPTLMFEYPTLSELAVHLGQRFPARFAARDVAHAGAQAATTRPTLPAERTAQSASPTHRPTPTSTGVQEPVAIIGISGRFAKAGDLAAFWSLLRQGADCITEIPPERWDAERHFDTEKGVFGKAYSKWGSFIDGVADFDPLFFGISPREAQVMDPQGRLFLETVWNLFEERGHTRDSLQQAHGGRVGVYVGAMYQQYAPLDGAMEWDSVASLTSYSSIANRVSHFFGLQGPSMAIDTMCSSSAMAIHQACKDLASGECELAVAGGVNLSIHPKKFIGLSQAQLLGSHPGSRSFADGDGYLPGEGVGAVLLKPLHRAQADGDTVLAVIRGSAVVHGGRANAYMAPNLAAQAQVIRQSLQRAGVSADSISYVESAANGSALGDPIEVAALVRAWENSPGATCALGSVKSNLGHPEAVSGLAQLAKVVLQLQHRELVPLAGDFTANPNLRLDGTPFVLQHEQANWERPVQRDAAGALIEHPRRALINSFAAGGTYVSLVIDEAPDEASSPEAAVRQGEAGAEHLFVLSARTPDRLREVVARLLARLDADPGLPLAALAHTLQTGREAMPQRLALVSASREHLLSVLRQYLEAPAGTGQEQAGPAFHSADSEEAGPRLKQLMGAKHLDELVQALIASRDLHRLAGLWVQGAIVPWQALQGTQRLPMLTLPTYPFARERFWLPTSETPATPKASPRAAVASPASRQEESPALDQRIQACIADFLSQTLAISPAQFMPNRPLRDHGLDSIIGMKLARHITGRFGIEVTARDMLEHPSAAALARRLAGKTPPSSNIAVETRGHDHLVAALEQFQRGELEMDRLKGVIERTLTA